jgi:hypothetical protein
MLGGHFAVIRSAHAVTYFAGPCGIGGKRPRGAEHGSNGHEDQRFHNSSYFD